MPTWKDAAIAAYAALWRLGVRRRAPAALQRAIFARVHERNVWGDAESISGPGSTRARGAAFREELLALLQRYEIGSILDAPCGDFNWMRDVVAEWRGDYAGVDVVEALIRANAACYGAPDRRFVCADVTRDPLPRADLVLCRDALVHLSFADALAALDNFRRSGARWLLATTFVARERNDDVRTGSWRALNLERPPFSLGPAEAYIDEKREADGGAYRDKRLGLWRLAACGPRDG